MHELRDFCWLAKQVQNRKIFTYYMEDMENTAIAETIEREMPLLFGEVRRCERPEAAIVFSRTAESRSSEDDC